MFPQLLRSLRELAFPPVCQVCNRLIDEADEHFCAACRHALTDDPHVTCPRCSSSIGEFADVSKGCPNCRDDHFQFESSFRLGLYDGVLRLAVLRIKTATGEMLAECVGSLWARAAENRFRQTGADVVVPVPLHWWRKWRRGFNQSEALAEAIARQLHLPLLLRAIRRVRHTPHQTFLSAAERRTNLRGAFQPLSSNEVKGRTVLLVDDVLTTGSTASEAARALREAGAARVVVAVLAHRG